MTYSSDLIQGRFIKESIIQGKLWEVAQIPSVMPSGETLDQTITRLIGSVTASVERVDYTFTNVDLSQAGMLVKNHAKGKSPSDFLVLDNQNRPIYISGETGDLGTQVISLPFEGIAPITGTWKLIVIF